MACAFHFSKKKNPKNRKFPKPIGFKKVKNMRFSSYPKMKCKPNGWTKYRLLPISDRFVNHHMPTRTSFTQSRRQCTELSPVHSGGAAQQKLICTSTNGCTSAVSLVTRFFKADHRLTYVSRWSTSSTYHRTGWQRRNTKKIVHHKMLHILPKP